MTTNEGWRRGLIYGFGHLVSSLSLPDSPHAGDSRDLADDVFTELGLSGEEVGMLWILAEYVAENYDYTGAKEL